MIPYLSYIICPNPRSGSWLLAAGLEDTRIAGRPSEWFNAPEERLWCERWKLPYPIKDYEQYLIKVLEAGSAGTNIFGVKCLRQHFTEIAIKFQTIPRYRDLPMKEVMSLVFPNLHYIWLRRRDLIRQAISYYRASQTQVWWIIKGHSNRPPADTRSQPPYDHAGITRCYHLLKDMDWLWQQYFEASNITPLTIYYEDLEKEYEKTVRDVLAYLGIPAAQSPAIPTSRFKKQADAITEEWVKRYQAVYDGTCTHVGAPACHNQVCQHETA